jgi:hypothetical protein
MKISEPAGNKMANAKIEGNEDETVLVPLLPTEDFMLQTGTMLVSTLTWFHGEYAVAADKLQARLVALVGANPWLTGCIVRRSGINYLAFNNSGNDEATLAKAARALFTLVPPEQSPLSRDTPIIQAASIVREAGYTCRCSLNDPLFAVTVVPCRTNPTSKFAVVVSMSHIAGDGHTFYCFYNFLVGADENTRGYDDKQRTSVIDECSLPHLKVERIATSLQQIGQVIRDHQTKDDPKQKRLSKEPRELFLAQSPGFLLPTILSVIAAKALKFLSLIAAKVRQTLSLNAVTAPQGHDRSGSDCPHTATLRYCWIDGKAIQRLKQEAMDQRLAAKDSSTTGCTSSTNSFVSTNDVFTSWFMLNSGCRHGFMAVNLRGRLSGHDSHHAGNYITVVYYRVPLDCANPYLIRSSIEPLCRTITSSIPPSRWLGGGAAFATTWATFASARVTLGENCREELHFPLFGTPLNEHPPNIVMGYIFRARGHRLGMFFVGTPSKLKCLDPCPFACESDFLTPVESTGTTVLVTEQKCHVD